MARTSTPTPAIKESSLNEIVLQSDTAALNQLAALQDEAGQNAIAMAEQIGYEGTISIGTLEDEIRFFQRRTVEALLETGKRLLVLKELTVHGEFANRVELLGLHIKTAQRFMQAAVKTSKSDKLSYLSTQVKGASAFLELITHDDDVLDGLQEMDNFDRMSASQLRTAARELLAEAEAERMVSAQKAIRIETLERKAARVSKMPADAVLAELQKEATAIMNDALGCVRGGLRQALIALKNYGDTDSTDNTLFMAGMVGQVQADLNALREEFNLPDLSNAADSALAAEVAQWAGK